MAITIELPTKIEKQLQNNWFDLEIHALEGFVVEAFRNGKLSSYQVSVALGLENRWQAIDFLSQKGVYPNYDMEDFKEDMRTQEILFSRKKNR